MRRVAVSGVIGVLVLAPVFAAAETAYVTDNLRLRMFASPELSGDVVRTLESGDAFEVLARDRRFIRVQMPDGATGYVSPAYIVEDKPAKLIVAETQAANDRLTSELADLRESFAEPAALIDSLKGEATELQAQLNQSSEQVAELQDANQSLEARHARYQYSLPFTWVGGAIVVCLIAGFLVGLWWVDRQSRRRHGGIRVL